MAGADGRAGETTDIAVACSVRLVLVLSEDARSVVVHLLRKCRCFASLALILPW